MHLVAAEPDPVVPYPPPAAPAQPGARQAANETLQHPPRAAQQAQLARSGLRGVETEVQLAPVFLEDEPANALTV